MNYVNYKYEKPQYSICTPCIVERIATGMWSVKTLYFDIKEQKWQGIDQKKYKVTHWKKY